MRSPWRNDSGDVAPNDLRRRHLTELVRGRSGELSEENRERKGRLSI